MYFSQCGTDLLQTPCNIFFQFTVLVKVIGPVSITFTSNDFSHMFREYTLFFLHRTLCSVRQWIFHPVIVENLKIQCPFLSNTCTIVISPLLFELLFTIDLHHYHFVWHMGCIWICSFSYCIILISLYVLYRSSTSTLITSDLNNHHKTTMSSKTIQQL